jgi:shikimate dehydrogenase
MIYNRWMAKQGVVLGAGGAARAIVAGLIEEGAPNSGLDALAGDAVFSDIVYAPLETPLLAAARARGLAASDGLGMLLHQACPRFRARAGVEAVASLAN